MQKDSTLQKGGCEKYYPVLRGGGAQTISDPRFSHFVTPPPPPRINDQSLTSKETIQEKSQAQTPYEKVAQLVSYRAIIQQLSAINTEIPSTLAAPFLLGVIESDLLKVRVCCFFSLKNAAKSE